MLLMRIVRVAPEHVAWTVSLITPHVYARSSARTASASPP
jgi:hypothetical protein